MWYPTRIDLCQSFYASGSGRPIVTLRNPYGDHQFDDRWKDFLVCWAILGSRSVPRKVPQLAFQGQRTWIAILARGNWFRADT